MQVKFGAIYLQSLDTDHRKTTLQVRASNEGTADLDRFEPLTMNESGEIQINFHDGGELSSLVVKGAGAGTARNATGIRKDELSLVRELLGRLSLDPRSGAHRRISEVLSRLESRKQSEIAEFSDNLARELQDTEPVVEADQGLEELRADIQRWFDRRG